MCRFVSLALGLLLTTLAVASLIGLAPVMAAPTSPPPPSRLQQTGATSPCQPVFTKVAYPKTILLGEEIGITLTVKAVCAGERIPLHIVLVMDGSGSMAGTPSQKMKQAAEILVRGLQLADSPWTKVGVVEFNTVARTLAVLTNSESEVISAINAVEANGGTAIDAGIREGLKVLRQGRRNDEDPTEAMVVLSNGHNDAGCNPVLVEAGHSKAQGVLMVAVCVGPGCDTVCMRQVATNGRYYFEAENASALKSVFQQIGDRVFNINLKKLQVKDTLPDGVEYVPGSARPSPARPDVVSNWLEWEDVYVPKDGVTYTLRVRPTRAGYIPANQEAWGQLTDSKDRTRKWFFRTPWITVFGADALPSPAVPPRTPTFTPTPTHTPAPTTAPATATSIPEPAPVFLPVTRCERR
jgi:uncharacterized protein YegL